MPIQNDRPGGGAIEAADDVEARGLSRTRSSHDREKLATANRQADSVERPDLFATKLVRPNHVGQSQNRVIAAIGASDSLDERPG